MSALIWMLKVETHSQERILIKKPDDSTAVKDSFKNKEMAEGIPDLMTKT